MSSGTINNFGILTERPVTRVVNGGTLGGGVSLSAIDTTGTLFSKSLIPGANISFIDGGDSITISSLGGGGGFSGSASTFGASSAIMSVILIPNNTTRAFKVCVTTGNSTDNLSSFHLFETAFQNVAGTVTQVDPPENGTDFTDYGVDCSNISFVIVGASVEITVLGLIGKTINWTSITQVLDVAL